MATPVACSEHRPAPRREINPKTRIITRRCARCGAILERFHESDLELL